MGKHERPPVRASTSRVERLLAAGVPPEDVIIDPLPGRDEFFAGYLAAARGSWMPAEARRRR